MAFLEWTSDLSVGGTEERLFEQYHHPKAVEQREQHDALTKQALELPAQLKGGRLLVSIMTLHFLKGWVAKHIMKTDKGQHRVLSLGGRPCSEPSGPHATR